MTRQERKQIGELGFVLVSGTKHLKVVCPLDGCTVGVAPRGTGSHRNDRGFLNLLATLRRHQREHLLKEAA